MSRAAIESKRRRVVEVIERTAPHIRELAGMLDEVKVDLILIALAGERLDPTHEGGAK